MGGRKQKFRQPSPGIYIIGEGITERYYFDHLKSIFDFSCTIKPRFFPNNCIDDIASRITQLLRNDIHIICVFDADVTRRNEKENEKLVRLRLKYKKNTNVIFAESLPSIEYWFLLHFKDTCKHFNNSQEVEREVRKYLEGYEKTENYLKNEKWVKDLSLDAGDLELAINRAKKYTSDDLSYSNIFLAIEKLKDSSN
jgi:hypothetical protein